MTQYCTFPARDDGSCVPPLGASVLEPCLDLRVGHLEVLGEAGPLGGGEVLLLVEPLLQLADLDPRERRPRLLPLRPPCPT